MPRRNNRERYEPLDLTPTSFAPAPRRSQTERETQAEYHERRRRRADAKLNGGIDWSACLIPGCGNAVATYRTDKPEWRDHRVNLPLCFTHLASVYDQVRWNRGDPLMLAALTAAVERRTEKTDAEEAARQKAWMARTDGHIYFVRLNDLVKVGWTRDLEQRIKSYGASAVLLVSYAGTRDDETHLHRQLAPARAKGREWYEDGPIIQRFIDKALAQYGQPPTLELWTTPKKIVAGKRH